MNKSGHLWYFASLLIIYNNTLEMQKKGKK